MVPTPAGAILRQERSVLATHYFRFSFKTSTNTNPILNVNKIKRFKSPKQTNTPHLILKDTKLQPVILTKPALQDRKEQID